MTSVWREVGDRVWVRRYEPLDQTIGVIGAGDALVVVDTRASHLLADELRTELRQLAGDVAAAINTHGHWDHVFGNARFLPVPIWGHVRCATMILETGDAQRARAMGAAAPNLAAELAEVELVPPSELFAEAATLFADTRTIELRHLGRGHTDNDVIAWVPDASVLFAGDLLENAPAPDFGDSFPIEWADTGRRLLDLPAQTVVPGHGDPFDRHFAERQVAELGALAELARQTVSGAIGLDEALRRSPFPGGPSAAALERARLELK